MDKMLNTGDLIVEDTGAYIVTEYSYEDWRDEVGHAELDPRIEFCGNHFKKDGKVWVYIVNPLHSSCYHEILVESIEGCYKALDKR